MTSTLMYPKDLSKSTGDYITFDFFKYEPPYKGASGNSAGASYVQKYNGAFDDGSGLSSAGLPTIIMYMPEDFSTSYSGKWGGREFGPLAGAGLALAGGIMNMNDQAAVKAAYENVTGQIDSIKGGAMPYIGASMVSTFMNKIPGMGGSVSANDILASTRGEILNPNTEVLYQGPDLRTFNINFKMYARSRGESDTILNICKQFKKAMLPTGKDTATNLIGVPNIVKVRFKQKSSENPWVTKYKCAALGNVGINYTPDGTWSTFSSGAPVAVGLQLQFMELKLVYSEDITNGY